MSGETDPPTRGGRCGRPDLDGRFTLHRLTTVRIHHVVTFGLGVVIGLWVLAGTAIAAPLQERGGDAPAIQGSPAPGCDETSETGARGHRPGDGCVGNADGRDPRGQGSDGSDPDTGYECDGNRGVAPGNPAHTSCPPPVAGDGSQPPVAGTAQPGAGATGTGGTPAAEPGPDGSIARAATSAPAAPDPAEPDTGGTGIGDAFTVERSQGTAQQPAPAPAVQPPAVQPQVAAAPAASAPADAPRAAARRAAEVLGVTVSRPGGELASTGAPLLPAALLGVGLCLGGAILLGWSRRPAGQP